MADADDVVSISAVVLEQFVRDLRRCDINASENFELHAFLEQLIDDRHYFLVFVEPAQISGEEEDLLRRVLKQRAKFRARLVFGDRCKSFFWIGELIDVHRRVPRRGH